MENLYSQSSHSSPSSAHPTVRLYLIVFAFLAVLTAAEVGVGYIPDSIVPKVLTYPLLLLLTGAKALLVALFYMHLRYDNRWFLGMMLISLPLAVLFILVVVLGFRVLAP